MVLDLPERNTHLRGDKPPAKYAYEHDNVSLRYFSFSTIQYNMMFKTSALY